jgi:hypothetical protein
MPVFKSNNARRETSIKCEYHKITYLMANV